MTSRQLAPLFLLTCLALTQLLAVAGVLPPPAQLFELLAHAVAASITLVAVCALIENTVVVNAIFPGAVAILYGMASTHGDVHRGILVFCAISIASFVGQNISFAFGRLASRSMSWTTIARSADATLEGAKPGNWRTAAVAYWHPTTGTAYSYYLGFNAGTYTRFLLFYVVVGGFWTLAWGLTMYRLGTVPISGESLFLTFFAGAAMWFFLETILANRTTKRERTGRG